MSKENHIFISHSSSNDEIADKICNILERNGLPCHMDHRDFKPGTNWATQIIDGIENSFASILLLSDESNKSEQIEREVQLIADGKNGKRLFPVRLQNIEPSRNLKYFLSLKNWTDAFDEPTDENLNVLIENLQEIINADKPNKDQFFLHHQKALKYKKEDPEVSIQYLEKSINGICKAIYSEISKVDKNINLSIEELILNFKENKIIPGHILVQFDIIQSFRNYINQNTQDISEFLSEDYIAPSLEALSIIINWFYKDFIKGKAGTYNIKDNIKYDISICYSQGNLKWVESHIKQILLNCITNDGNIPEINFIQIDKKSSNNNEFINQSIESIKISKNIIFVISSDFLTGEVEQLIFKHTLDRYLTHTKRKIIPIQLPEIKDSDIPIAFLSLNYILFEENIWKTKLANCLNYKFSESTKNSIQFDKNITNTSINQTLNSVKVILSDKDNSDFSDRNIELVASNNSLKGTTIKKTINGIAEFNDLYFMEEDDSIYLTAKCAGYTNAISNTFSISEIQENKKTITDSFIELKSAPIINSYLFNNSNEALINYQNSFTLCDLQNNRIKNIELKEPIKQIVNSKNQVFVIEWSGKIHPIISINTEISTISPDNEFVYQIPSFSSVYENELYIAYLNGYIYKLDKNNTLKPVLKHSNGIHYFAQNNKMLIFYDSEGKIYKYVNNELELLENTEKNILGLHATNNAIIIVGEHNLYHYTISDNKLITEKSGLVDHYSVFFSVDFFAILNIKGVGAIYDYEFVKLASFQSAKGSTISFISNNKEYILLSYPNDTKVLMKNSKILFSSKNSSLTIDDLGKTILYVIDNKLYSNDVSAIESEQKPN